MSTRFDLVVLLLSLGLIQSSSCTIIKHRCPVNCTIAGIRRDTLDRLKEECPNSEMFVKCSTSLWRAADGTLSVSFDGDSSMQAINESLIPPLPGQFFYHHTQVMFYANVSETKVNIHNACFDRDDCSRAFAQQMADQLLGYSYIELEQQVQPLIYDPAARTEIQFFTTNLQCVINHNSTVAPCNTTCYVSVPPSQQQPTCWLGTIVSLHVYTEVALPAPVNTTVSFSYTCNTYSSPCNGPDISLKVTKIVNEFFQNPPYVPLPNSSTRCETGQLVYMMLIAFVFLFTICAM